MAQNNKLNAPEKFCFTLFLRAVADRFNIITPTNINGPSNSTFDTRASPRNPNVKKLTELKIITPIIVPSSSFISVKF